MEDDEERIGGEDGESKPLDELAADNERFITGESSQHMDGRETRGRDIDIQAIREVMYALHAVSIGTHQLLYFSAMKYCKNHMDRQEQSVESAADSLADIFDRMNIGSFRLTENDESEDRIMFEMDENALAFDANTDKPICYFISGYIAGYLENTLEGHYVVNEISCISQGNEVCVFRAQKR